MSTKAKEIAAPKMPATAIRTRLAPRSKKSCKSTIIISSLFFLRSTAPKVRTAESAISGPFHLKKRVPAHPSGAPDLSSAKPCLPSLLALKADRSPPRRPQLSAVQACFGRCSNALHAPVSKERLKSASGAGSAESSAHCAGADVNSQLSCPLADKFFAPYSYATQVLIPWQLVGYWLSNYLACVLSVCSCRH